MKLFASGQVNENKKVASPMHEKSNNSNKEDENIIQMQHEETSPTPDSNIVGSTEEESGPNETPVVIVDESSPCDEATNGQPEGAPAAPIPDINVIVSTEVEQVCN